MIASNDPRVSTLVEDVRGLKEIRRIQEVVKTSLTAEALAFYRSLAAEGWVAANDRQSLTRTALDPDKVGLQSRIDAIMREKTTHFPGCTLPRPTEKEDRQPGEARYDFDPRIWFVDGDRGKNATGFSFSPFAVPEKWRLWALVQELGKIDRRLLPKAIVYADDFRLARRSDLYRRWVDGLKHYGIPVYVAGSGEREGLLLDMMVTVVEISSRKFKEDTRRSREAFKASDAIFSGHPPLGLLYTGPGRDQDAKIKTEIWTDPVPYRAIVEMTEKLASGEIPHGKAAEVWLSQTHGIDRTDRWIAWLYHPVSGFPSWLTGTHTLYGEKHHRKELRDRETGLDWEWDISENGYQKYYREYVEGKTFKVQYSEGTSRIPPAVLAAATRAVTKRGAPEFQPPAPDRHLSYCPPRKLICKTCGFCIEERAPDYDPKHRKNRWRCLCMCVTRLQQQGKKVTETDPATGKTKTRTVRLSREEARAEEIRRFNHRRSHPGSVSLALWAALDARLSDRGYEWVIPEPVDRAALLATEGRLRATQGARMADLVAINQQFAAGLYGDPNDPVERQAFDLQKAALRKQYDQVSAALAQVSAELLTQQPIDAQTLEMVRAKYMLVAQVKDEAKQHALRRTIIDALVEKVVIDLETGEWEAEMVLDAAGLEKLAGVLATEGCVNRSQGAMASVFHLGTLTGWLAA